MNGWMWFAVISAVLLAADIVWVFVDWKEGH